MNRREFLAVAAVALQGTGQGTGQQAQTNFAAMDDASYKPVTRPAKPNATPSMTDAQRDLFEHDVRCMCGCTLDVYTCRTTDFTCPVSPPMHRDIQALVAGGYSGDEILDAFVATYGERVRTAPKRSGFNWAGYLMPSVAMAGGAVAVTMLLRKWTRAAQVPALAAAPRSIDASPEELARLRAALYEDEDEE